MAVTSILEVASDVNLETIREILATIGAPLGAAPAVLRAYLSGAPLLTCECPESGDELMLPGGEEGDEYKCPDCRKTILVQDGDAYHDLLETCPIRKAEYWISAVEGDYICPECAANVTISRGRVHHAKV
jgi:Zn finger protein HypA/HybF involved in hydrogenase expression